MGNSAKSAENTDITSWCADEDITRGHTEAEEVEDHKQSKNVHRMKLQIKRMKQRAMMSSLEKEQNT